MGSRFGPQSAIVSGALGFLLISGTVSIGCINKSGEPIIAGLLSFPIAVELSLDEDPDGNPKHLYVASSNFALQYNSGNLQSYDLDRMVDAVIEGCVGQGFRAVCLLPGADPTNPGCACDPVVDLDCVGVGAGVLQSCLEPEFEGDVNDEEVCGCAPVIDEGCVSIPRDRCSVVPAGVEVPDQGVALRLVPVDGLIPGEVQIGSFADGLGVSTDGRRLYLPVRSDANLTFIDTNEQGQLRCGGEFGELHTCTAPYRTGSAELENPTLDLVVPRDPVDVYVGSLAEDFGPPDDRDDPAFRGDYILMAHREGAVSMFFDRSRTGGPEPQRRPRLAATLTGLAPEQVTITYEPGARRAWVPSAVTAQIIRVGIAIDGDPLQSYLFNAGTVFVTGLDNGAINRDILFDPRPDRNLAYIVSKAPEALVVARSEVAGGDLNMVGQISSCRDPSRVQLAEVPARGGVVVLAFVSCFLSRNVQVIDADLLQGVTVLTNISGAFEFAIDTARRLIYIADFNTSVLRVANLRPLLDCLDGGSTSTEECSPELLGLVGFPQPVSGLPR